MLRHGVGPLALVVPVVHAVAPVVGRAFGPVAEPVGEALAVHPLGDLAPRELDERRREVDVLGHEIRGPARFEMPGPPHDERRPEALLVHPPLVVPAVFAEVPALVAGVDDDRVVGDPEAVELVEDRPDALVDRGDAGEVVLDVTLVLRADEIVARELAGGDRLAIRLVPGLVPGVPRDPLRLVEFRRRTELEIPFVEVAGDRHGLQRARRTAVGVVVEQGGRLGDLDALEEPEVPRVGVPSTVGSLVLDADGERAAVLLRGLGELPKGGDALLRDDVGRVAPMGDPAVGGLHGRVVVGALADEDAVVVEAHGIGPEVPLPEDAGAVARVLQDGRPARLGPVEPLLVRLEAVPGGEAPGEERGPARAADRVLDEEAVESDALASKPVDLGRVVHPGAVGATVGADRLPGVVVAHDEDDVRALLLARDGVRGRGHGGDGEGEAGREEQASDGGGVHGGLLGPRTNISENTVQVARTDRRSGRRGFSCS